MQLSPQLSNENFFYYKMRLFLVLAIFQFSNSAVQTATCPASYHWNPVKAICEENVCYENVTCRYGWYWDFYTCKCVKKSCKVGIGCQVSDASRGFNGRHIDFSFPSSQGHCITCIDDCPYKDVCKNGTHWSRRHCGCIVDCYENRECRDLRGSKRYWDTEYCSCECDVSCFPLNPTTCSCPKI